MQAYNGGEELRRSIPGLFAGGELNGGFFFLDYPLDRGLNRGTVFGKLAGEAAAAARRQEYPGVPPL